MIKLFSGEIRPASPLCDARALFKSVLFGAALISGAVISPAQDVTEEAFFAYPTNDGVAWIDSFKGVALAKSGEPPRIVWDGITSDLSALSGNQLVMGWMDQLLTFPSGSWTPRITSTGKRITALAASSETALAFDALAGLWRLEKDGSWSRHESGIQDYVRALAWHRGLWIAAGATRGIEPEDGEEEDEEDLRYGGKATPTWVMEKTLPRIWWSTDGVKWHPGSLPNAGYNSLAGVAGSNTGWLAAGLDGTMYGSSDGKTWQRAGRLNHTSQSDSLRLVAMGEDFLICFGDEHWLRSADGRDWTPVPLAKNARLDAPFMKDGKAYAVGLRTAGRRLEVAELAAFANIPGPDAAELAAVAAADKKARVTAEDKRLDMWAQKLAAWDVAIGKAKDTPARRALWNALHADWKAAHPGYTPAQAVTYLTLIFNRVTGYEVSDLALYGFVFDSMKFSRDVAVALPQTLPAEVQRVFKQIATDQLAIMRAKQQNITPPVFPPRLKTKTNPPAPQSGDAPFDIEAVRLLAARGDAAAAYDLGLVYLNGQGVPTDPVASRFWMRQAALAGLKFLEASTNDQETQVKSWQKLAGQGSRMALKYYADMLQAGLGVPADPAAALVDYKRAAAAGQYEAMVDLYRAYSRGNGTEIDHAVSRQYLEEAGGFGFPPAIAQLGWIYEVGAHVPRDLAKSAAYYRRASDLGYGSAMKRYADFLLAGHGVPADQAAGKQWMGKAAATGDGHAQAALAQLNAGKYQPADLAVYAAPKESRPTFDVARRLQQAESGDAAACYDLAYAYWNGVGVRQDNAAGNRWLTRAKAAGWKMEETSAPGEQGLAAWKIYADRGSIVAMDKQFADPSVDGAEKVALLLRAGEAGSARAQSILGELYRRGVGVPADQAEAFKWYERAAKIGDLISQRMTGYCYDIGSGIAQNDAEAVRWYSLAAEGEDLVAMGNLAHLYTQGRGVTAPDPAAASALYLRLAGLPGDAVSPAEAAARIRPMAEAGNLAAYEAWAIMLQRGFGVPADANLAFAYGFVATQSGEAAYPLSWFDFRGKRPALALRQAAMVLFREQTFYTQEMSKNPTIAANIASGKFPTPEGILAMARPEKSATVRFLRALEEGSVTLELAQAAEASREPFNLPGLGALVTAANARRELADQWWLLRLAGVSEKTTDEDETEKLFQKALLAPSANDADTFRLQTLRRLAAARLYYGIGREADLPAALAWAMISVTDADSLLAVELLSRELSAAQIDSADELYQRINARLTPAKK